MVENLYRTYTKEYPESPVQECICSDCADEINKNDESDVYAELDSYATRCWEPDEETCSVCGEYIDRTNEY